MMKSKRRESMTKQQELTHRQREVFQYIKQEIQQKGYPPTVREICEAVGLHSPSTVHAHLKALEEKGLIKRNAAKPRAMEIINLQLSRRKAMRKAIFHWLLIALCAGIVLISAALVIVNSPYLGWDYHDPELAVAGTVFHAFEWLFVRLAPIVLIAAMVGVYLTRKKA